MTSDVGVLLGGYPAKQCARRTHNDFDNTVPTPPSESPAALARMAEGRDFEDHIVTILVAALGNRCVNITYGDHHEGKERRIAATMTAITTGIPVIIGGQLPDDRTAGRTGSPDILIRVTNDGEYPRYVPADIKHHSTLKPGNGATAQLSALPNPFTVTSHNGHTSMGSHRVGDAIQLAHYTRMLEAIDRHPGTNMMLGAILGTSDFTTMTGDRYGFVWYDLATPTEKTWSTTEAGWVKRSVMDVYDHAFAFRVQVAQAARAGQPALVRPYGKAECGECPYLPFCRTEAGPRDASFAITKGQLTDREWVFLNQRGLGTVDTLADATPEGELLDAFTAVASNLQNPAKRLTDAIHRAKMHRDNVAFERTGTGVLTVPAADVEIDFDVEWHPKDDLVYQWGARVRYNSDESTATYDHTVVSFDTLNEETAQELAEEFFTWLEGFITHHESAGRTVGIYHWTNPETTRTVKALGRERADRLFRGRFVDLAKFLSTRYFARDGFSLKTVAPVFGFKWSADDAGGLMSTIKVDEARHATDPDVRQAAREWLLSYNEDDCAAQAAIRDGLRHHLTAPVIHDTPK